MYPKPSSSRSSSSQVGRREQLTDLLMNKFRSKYHVNLSTERDIDNEIRKEIEKALKATHSLQEKDLNEIDAKVAVFVKNVRPQASMVNDDAMSQRSRKSQAMSSVSQTQSQRQAAELFDMMNERQGSRGKPPGMTEGEWNEIVQKSFHDYKQQEKDKKEKLVM